MPEFFITNLTKINLKKFFSKPRATVFCGGHLQKRQKSMFNYLIYQLNMSKIHFDQKTTTVNSKIFA